jgi:hypothetical protein
VEGELASREADRAALDPSAARSQQQASECTSLTRCLVIGDLRRVAMIVRVHAQLLLRVAECAHSWSYSPRRQQRQSMQCWRRARSHALL